MPVLIEWPFPRCRAVIFQKLRTGIDLMRLRLYISLFFYLCALSLSGQVQFGIEGGAGLNAQTGLHLALPVEWKISTILNMHTGPVFIVRSQSEILDKLGGDLDYRHLEMSYLSLPLLLKVHWHFSDFSAFTSLGPSLAFSPGMGVNYLERGTLYRERLSFTQLRIRQWAYGLDWEAGFRTEIRGGKIIYTTFRYHLGLSDIDAASDNEIYHQGGLVMIGLLLPLKIEKKEIGH